MKNLTFRPSVRAFISIFLFGISFVSFAQIDSTSTFHFGLIYPLSTNGKHAADYTNRFSLHAIAGISKAETGVAISGAANVVRQDAAGIQIAGAVNLVSNNVNGIQIAGGANLIGNNANGVQIAGFSNIIRNEANGAQIAGFINLTGNANSAQIAGFTNISRNDAKGIQVAGFFNKANEVNAQVAGFVNVAKKVKGIQLAGFINIADTSDYPIAIFNFIKSGEKSFAVTVDENMTTIASFRSGGRVLYGIAGVGYNVKDSKHDLYAVEAGLGAHIPLVTNLRLNLEVVSQSLSNFKKAHYYKNSIRVIPAYKLGSKLEIFAGPTVNFVNYKRGNEFDFVKRYIWINDDSRDFQGVHLGFNAGVQVLL